MRLSLKEIEARVAQKNTHAFADVSLRSEEVLAALSKVAPMVWR